MDMTVYKRPEFETTCEAIDNGISKGEISTNYIGEFGIYPDDVKAVQDWVESQAEELHEND